MRSGPRVIDTPIIITPNVSSTRPIFQIMQHGVCPQTWNTYSCNKIILYTPISWININK